MNLKIFLMLVFFIAALSGLSTAQDLPEKDVDVTIILPDEINVSVEYKDILMVKNHNDTPGVNDGLELNVMFNLTSGNQTVKYFSTKKTINYYSKSGMGSINISSPGNYSLCASIEPLNYFDAVWENDQTCKNITVTDPFYVVDEINFSENVTVSNESVEINDSDTFLQENETCGYSLFIFTSKQLYEKGDTIKFRIYLNNDSNSSFPLEINYWVEDLFGKITKKIVTTTSKSEKSYTPRFSETEKSYIIMAKNENCSLNAERLVVLRGEKETRETEIELITPEKVTFGKIFFVEINGYKGSSSKTLISIWVEDEKQKISETTKVYINLKNTEFKQRIPIVFKKNEPEGNEFRVIASGLGVEKEKEIELDFLEKKIEEKKIDSYIKSFYTMKKNFGDEIKIYLSIENPLDHYIELLSTVENQTIEADETVSVIVKISEPDETIEARLVKLIDKKYLNLSLKVDEKILAEATIVKQQQQEEKQELKPILTNKSVQQQVTNSPPDKIKTSQVVFFSAALVASVFLFRKNFRQLFLKKTKLYK